MTVRVTLRYWLPPVTMRLARRLAGRGLRFDGKYATWRDAQRASGGYDREDIVRRIYESELKVKQGKFADERDGVLFDAVQFSLPVIASLALVASLTRRDLQVLGLGGALVGWYRPDQRLVWPPVWS